MQTFIMSLQDIQPSQLYINVDKLQQVELTLDVNNLEPLPVKRLGQKVFFTDGHTRALALYMRGVQEIPVYWDQDQLDWTAYLVNLNWCDEEGIKTIADLHSRVVSSLQYAKLWYQRCEELHQALQENPDLYMQIVKVAAEAEEVSHRQDVE